uniref:Uncharacterized protein n=1 Tax=Bactrocera latifrons TaxID=174628 RepID=A0A0K8VNG0_BACLA
MLLGYPLSSQNACLSAAFSGKETKQSPLACWPLLGRCSQESRCEPGRCRGKLSIGCDVLSNPSDLSFERLENFHVKFGVDGLFRRNKFMVDDAFDVIKKQ